MFMAKKLIKEGTITAEEFNKNKKNLKIFWMNNLKLLKNTNQNLSGTKEFGRDINPKGVR